MVKLAAVRLNVLQRKNVKRQVKGQMPAVMPKDKGHFQGSCNRSDCLRPGASWYNHSTQAYYCGECAQWLNSDTYNKRDAQSMYGHDLCTAGLYDHAKYQHLHDLHRTAQQTATASPYKDYEDIPKRS